MLRKHSVEPRRPGLSVEGCKLWLSYRGMGVHRQGLNVLLMSLLF